MTRRLRKVVFAALVASSTAVAGFEAIAPIEPAAASAQFNKAAILHAPRARLESRLKWDIQHIKKLQHRRAYLKHYIRDLRSKLNPPTSKSQSASSSPTTTTSSTYTGGVLSDAQVTSYLLAAGFPSSAIPTMLYYSHRESGNNPRAINSSSGACGLFQLYPCYGGSAWLNPATNARLAYQKYQASGFAPWGG